MNDHEPSSENGHDDDAVARRLADQRPRAEAGFREGLRAALLEKGRQPDPAAPRRREGRGRRRRARALVAAYAGSGIALLAVAVAGVAGLGPLAA